MHTGITGWGVSARAHTSVNLSKKEEHIAREFFDKFLFIAIPNARLIDGPVVTVATALARRLFRL